MASAGIAWLQDTMSVVEVPFGLCDWAWWMTLGFVLWVGGGTVYSLVLLPWISPEKELGDQCGGCKWAEVYKFKGKTTGAIGFATAEDAASAISSLNGALIGGTSITADSWERGKK